MKLTRKQLGDREDLYLEKANAAADKAREASMAKRWTSADYWTALEKRHRDRAWYYCRRIAALYHNI